MPLGSTENIADATVNILEWHGTMLGAKSDGELAVGLRICKQLILVKPV